MPFLSWPDGDQLFRHSLDADCLAGRDPEACRVARPEDASVSRRHAALARNSGAWWIRDLDSRNGTLLNGLPVNHPQGNALRDGDQIRLGDWELSYTEGFPGLDPARYLEGVGDLFAEVGFETGQALTLVRGLELLQRSSEALLMETEAEALIRGLLREALKLLGAERGFVVKVEPDRSLRSVHRVGDVQDIFGLSRTVLDYVLVHQTGVASNDPMSDPRFGGQSLMEMGRGPLMCAPLGHPHEAVGALYLDRPAGGRPFSRFDLSLFQSFVRQGSIALRHAQVSLKALGHAEMEGELARMRAFHRQASERRAELLTAMASPLHWAARLAREAGGGDLLIQQLERLEELLGEATRESGGGEGPPEPGTGEDLASLQGRLAGRWKRLLEALGAHLEVEPAPVGTLWLARASGVLALDSLAERVLAQVRRGGTVSLGWERERGGWALKLQVPGDSEGPTLDPWSARALRDCGLSWRWGDQALHISFLEGGSAQPEARPRLGLVGCGPDLQQLFQGVGEAQGLEPVNLGSVPPPPPVPSYRYVVMDAGNLADPAETVRTYRCHPGFATCPILVVRVEDEATPALLAAGATDWLPVGFRWESLHNRLQVLRSHEELQNKALAAERLDSFRQMAGTLKHEINNPLAVISMQVEMLERKYPDEPRLAKINDMIERIQGLLQVLQKMREATAEAYADGSKILKPG